MKSDIAIIRLLMFVLLGGIFGLGMSIISIQKDQMEILRSIRDRLPPSPETVLPPQPADQ